MAPDAPGAMRRLPQAALDILFDTARSVVEWTDAPVPEADLQAIWRRARMGPTSANCSPLRVLFVASPAARAKLAETASSGNRRRILEAPVTAILAQDSSYLDLLPRLFPHEASARHWFGSEPAAVAHNGFRNATLQAAYLMLAARALGYDCGPMSGFRADLVDTAFFPDGRWRANFLCGIGIGNPQAGFPRSPRLDFEEACRIL